MTGSSRSNRRARTAKSVDDSAAVSHEATGLYWSFFASPHLTVALIALMALWIAAGSQMPQDLPREELMGIYSHPWLRFASGFGLPDIFTAWPFVVLVVLLGLNGLARRLDRVGREVSRPRGLLVPLPAEVTPAALRRALTSLLGARHIMDGSARAAADASDEAAAQSEASQWNALRASRGALLEAGALAVAGMACLVAGAFLHSTEGAWGRVEVIEAPAASDVAGAAAAARVLVPTERAWKVGGPGIGVRCGLGAGASLARTCWLQTADGIDEGVLAIGHPLRMGRISLSYDAVAPLSAPNSAGESYVLSEAPWGPDGQRAWKSATQIESGGGYPLGPSGARLEVARGPDGPALAVVSDADSTVYAGPTSNGTSGPRVRPPLELQLRFSLGEHRWWFYTGLFLLLLSALLFVLYPHIDVTVSVDSEGAKRLELRSLNRPDTARATGRKLLAALRGGGTSAGGPS